MEAALQDAAPDAASIVVLEASSGMTGSGFISLAQLQSGQTMTALSGSRPQQGD